ncbi:MAG: beta-ketoacyl-ACP synthase II [SAR202 cluster bacterium]|jgi:3-oxoacyl-[acyl-carrier-protein] synthase II|nr:beta-ketoacyl-ACP synthase II [SAR202 cluster bacterium]
MKSNRIRAVITGMGAMTPLGESIDDYWDGLVNGRSGIGPLTLCDTDAYPSKIAGEVTGFDPKTYIDNREVRRMARFSQFAVASAGVAIEDAGLNLSNMDRERIGVVMGNGNGGFPTTEDNARTLIDKGGMRLSPFFIPMVLPNMAAANVSRIYGLKGYTSTVVTACAAGTQGIGEAAVAIQRGIADVVLGGGCEAGICQLGLGGFNVIRALSRQNGKPERASRPFDVTRDGFVPAEGSAVLVIESLEHAMNRGANILAEVVGYGVSSDAFHSVQPDEDGSGAARAIRWALEDADLTPEDISYINAHGTSTPINDHIETLAIKKAFGDHAYNVPVSSTKSMIGHVLGGAGAIEAVACIKSIQTGEIHPTINHEHPDPECDLDYVPNKSRKVDVDAVLTNSFGFGGQNACVVFRKFSE